MSHQVLQGPLYAHRGDHPGRQTTWPDLPGKSTPKRPSYPALKTPLPASLASCTALGRLHPRDQLLLSNCQGATTLRDKTTEELIDKTGVCSSAQSLNTSWTIACTNPRRVPPTVPPNLPLSVLHASHKLSYPHHSGVPSPVFLPSFGICL